VFVGGPFLSVYSLVPVPILKFCVLARGSYVYSKVGVVYVYSDFGVRCSGGERFQVYRFECNFVGYGGVY